MRGVVDFFLIFAAAFGLLNLIPSIAKWDYEDMLISIALILPMFYDRPEVRGFLWIIAFFVVPALCTSFGLSAMSEVAPDNQVLRIAGGLAGFSCGVWIVVIVIKKLKLRRSNNRTN